MPVWEIDGKLARSARPGYSWEVDVQVPRETVDDWLAEARGLGIRSIICLLAGGQLSLYAEIPGGLLRHYEQAGFRVAHVPSEDHLRPPLSSGQLAAVLSAYQRLPKPVLVHCSAGISRSGAAVEHIMNQVRGLPAARSRPASQGSEPFRNDRGLDGVRGWRGPGRRGEDE